MVLAISVAVMNQQAAMGKAGSRLSRCLIVNRVEAYLQRGHIISTPSYYVLDRYVRNLKEPEAVAVYSESYEVVVYTEDQRIPQQIKFTDEVFWEIAELPFLEGVPFRKEAVDKAEMTAVISDRAKQVLFGSQPALGKYLETSQGSYRICGIIPRGEIRAMTLNADIYVPITTAPGKINNRELWGAEIALVQAFDKNQFGSIKREFQEHMDQLLTEHRESHDLETYDCFIGSMNESIANEINQPELVYLFGVVGMMIVFMLLPAVNLTTINISRILERAGEIGIRKTFGASSGVLMGQFIIENLFLTLIGGILALFGSWLVLYYVNDSGIVPWGYIHLDLNVFLYSLVITVFFGIFSGILPSYRMSRLHPAEALKGVNR